MSPEDFLTSQRTIREVCAGFDNKGRDFESLCEGLLRELGFAQVQQQNAGSQFGRDYSAFRDTDRGRERWFFECKNLRNSIDVSDAAPKLIHHLDRRNLHAFVILGPSQLSNELRELLERNPFPFPVFDWTGDAFVKAVMLATNTRRQWFGAITAIVAAPLLDSFRCALFESALMPAAAPLEVDIKPRNDPPYQMAYFLRGDELHEYTTEFEFEHQVMLHNRGRSPLLVTGLCVMTVAYEPLPQRLLVQRKAKGEFNPLYMSYSPTPVAGHRTELLAPRIRQLQPGETELHFMKLTGCPPGIYMLRVSASFMFEGRPSSIDVVDLPVCACVGIARTDSPDCLLLQTWRGHYSGAARAALSRTREDWELVAGAANDDRLLFLGPFPNEEYGRWPDRSVRARVMIVPLVRDEEGATLKLEEVQELCDWGEAVGDVAPDDPLQTMRSIAELHGMTLQEFAQRFGPKMPSE